MTTQLLKEPHYTWLKEIKGACDAGGVYLIEGGYPISKFVFTIDRNIYSDDERAALADLIRWGYCKWGGFLAGDLGCEITEEGKQQLLQLPQLPQGSPSNPDRSG